MLTSCRGSELVVIGSFGEDGSHGPKDRLGSHLIRNAGRPVLVLPKEAQLSGKTKRIMVGWSNTRECARAAHDAIMIAAPNAAFDLLSVAKQTEGMQHMLDSRDDFAGALDRLGYSANLLDRSADIENRGAALLKAASERDSELLVAGAFGHSKVYDFVIGAVTNHLLTHAKLPVLLSK